MAVSTIATKSQRPLALKLLRIAAVAVAVIVLAMGVPTLLAGSLGAFLLCLPGMVLGALTLTLLFKWPAKLWLSGVTLALFATTTWFAFHVLWKYVQPTVWPKHAVAIGNPWVIEGNVFTNNDYNNAVVIRLDDGSYRMYFHNRNDMMMAASADGKKFDEPIKLFEGEMPTVIQLPDGRLRMYYFVNVAQPQPQQSSANPGGPAPMNCGDNCPAPKHNFVSAVSTDGMHWTQEPGIRLAASSTGYDRDTMIHPTVIRLSDGTYKLYYDGEIDDAHSYALAHHYRKILSASSTDGLTWARDPGYRIDEKPLHTWEAYSPKAMYQNGEVILRFTTPNGIYQATSTDTLHFTISKNPIFSPGRIPMPGDDGALGSYQDAYALSVPGGQRMYFWIDGQGIFSAFQKS
ncbi:MAG TPA: hypothetical protein VLE99_05800 [Candidatus Saccharimonadales bacterium]|nr:hypothetical protein [Candidatus Saccharimonadales bacterium]